MYDSRPMLQITVPLKSHFVPNFDTLRNSSPTPNIRRSERCQRSIRSNISSLTSKINISIINYTRYRIRWSRERAIGEIVRIPNTGNRCSRRGLKVKIGGRFRKVNSRIGWKKIARLRKVIRGGNSPRFVLGHYTLTRAIEHIDGRVWGPRLKPGENVYRRARVCVRVTPSTAERALHGGVSRVASFHSRYSTFFPHVYERIGGGASDTRCWYPSLPPRHRCRCSAIYGPGEHPNRLRDRRILRFLRRGKHLALEIPLSSPVPSPDRTIRVTLFRFVTLRGARGSSRGREMRFRKMQKVYARVCVCVCVWEGRRGR